MIRRRPLNTVIVRRKRAREAAQATEARWTIAIMALIIYLLTIIIITL